MESSEGRDQDPYNAILTATRLRGGHSQKNLSAWYCLIPMKQAMRDLWGCGGGGMKPFDDSSINPRKHCSLPMWLGSGRLTAV